MCLVVGLLLAGCADTAGGPLDVPGQETPPASTAPFETAGPYEFFEFEAPDLLNASAPNATWRVFKGTGNCCENYLLTSPHGWILDFGGTFIQYTRDEGRTWSTVETPVPYLTGEGAIANAPGGDIVGVGWSPYTGDQAWAHRYDNATDTWSYMPMPIHWPFWDREWIVAIPGEFNVLGQAADYITIARGGWPYKDSLLVSGDGLTYVQLSVPAADVMLETVSLPAIEAGPDPERDWLQPASETTITDIGGSRALMRVGGCPRILESDLRWKCLELTEATLPPGRLLMDSRSALHVVSIDAASFAYSISHDGGRSWYSQTHTLPEGLRILDMDYKSHAQLDQTVVAIHASRGDDAIELLYRFTNLTGEPVLQEILQASTGGGTTDSGVTAEGARYDFMTTGLLPDGRAILSVSGMGMSSPGLAVEIG